MTDPLTVMRLDEQRPEFEFVRAIDDVVSAANRGVSADESLRTLCGCLCDVPGVAAASATAAAAAAAAALGVEWLPLRSAGRSGDRYSCTGRTPGRCSRTMWTWHAP